MVQKKPGSGLSLNPFTGGFSNRSSSQLNNVHLPDKIKCCRCEKLKVTGSNYSIKQIAEAKFRKSRGHLYQLKCYNCSGASKDEMLCTGCLEHKSLDKFSKTHRRCRDEARCMDCMKERLDNEQYLEGDVLVTRATENQESDDDSDIASSGYDPTETDDLTSYNDFSVSRIPMDALSINGTECGSTSRYYPSTVGASPSVNTSMNTYGGSSGGVRLPVDFDGQASWQSAPSTRRRFGTVAGSVADTEGKSEATVSNHNRSSFDRNGYGNPYAAGSVVSRAAPSTVNPRTYPSASRFPKVKAFKPPISQPAESQPVEKAETEEDYHSRSSDHEWSSDGHESDEEDSDDEDEDED